MTDELEIPADATAVAICSCGARAWTTGDPTAEDAHTWFEDFHHVHADCDQPDIEDPDGDDVDLERAVALVGEAADDREFFRRAIGAKERAEYERDWSARRLADTVLKTGAVGDFDTHWYRQAVAALGYAKAVYEEQAEPIRARREAAGVAV